ncbi:S-layer homology domain-containing protein [Paenibacillus oryzisoli]|uniref:S-layer homology domain-containing protein n=1 Tax=Paenibacillus oryzisoli TaxID=1850517 RepID=UPI003D27387C
MRRRVSFKKVMCFLLVLTFSLLLGSAMASARGVYTTQDQTLGAKEPLLANIAGNHMVWTESDADGYLQVFYQDIRSGEKKQITSNASQKHSPHVGETKDGEVYIIWTDGRDYAATQTWSMYGYQLSSGHEWKLDVHPEYYTVLNMNGSEFVGSDNATSNIVHYNLRTNQETLIGKGRIPVVADGKVLYKHEGDGGLSLTVVATGQTRVVLDLPYHLYVWDLAFDGTWALYKSADLDLKTKYVVLNTSDPAAVPVDLTPATKKSVEYYQMYIGNGQVAWVQDQGGTPVLQGYNVALKESFNIASGDQALRVKGFDQGGLIMKQADGSLFAKAITRIEVPDVVGGGTASVITTDAIKSNIGTAGGKLTIKDGSAGLTIPPGAVSKDTEMEIKLNSTVTDTMEQTKQIFMRVVSKAWDLNLGGPLLQKGTLTLAFDTSKWNEGQVQKMVVHRWNASLSRWEPVFTRLKSETEGIAAEITESGTYALFDRDVTFADGTDHWACTAIEVLASRGIVDGLSDEQFVPDGVLTRAQFTKMLVGALQLKPAAGGATFKDVPSSHWSHDWVEAAVSAGLVQGDGLAFNPDEELSREQMMIMLVRAVGGEQQALAMSNEKSGELLAFTDAEDVSSWAFKYAALSSQLGLIEGDNGSLRPQASSTRAQAATVIYRMLWNMK